MSVYNNKFYQNRNHNTQYSAETILSIVQSVIPEIISAVDLGCGVGTWLHVLEKRGATVVCGVDGNWVNKNYLKIKKENFVGHDFSESMPNIDGSFDLAISLEVAEHLSSVFANRFVSLLTGLSDFVLFSAAIPYQGGVNHVNEQWPKYWISIFENYGYVALDIIRKNIWDDIKIQQWYRRNTLLYVRKERIIDLKLISSFNDHIPPEVYLLYFDKAISPGIKLSFKNLIKAVKRKYVK